MDKTNFDEQRTIRAIKSIFELIENNTIKISKEMIKTDGFAYPALQSILVCMELLGSLISNKKSRNAFSHFWKERFEKKFPEYKGLEKIFLTIRDGIAHLTFPKGSVNVSKNGENHLKAIATRNGVKYLNVDIEIFFYHFLDSFEQLKKSLLEEPKDPTLLRKSWKGFSGLFHQIEVAKKEVTKYLENLDARYTPNVKLDQLVISNVEESTITILKGV